MQHSEISNMFLQEVAWQNIPATSCYINALSPVSVLQVRKGQKSKCGTSVAGVHEASFGIEGLCFGVVRIDLRWRLVTCQRIQAIQYSSASKIWSTSVYFSYPQPQAKWGSLSNSRRRMVAACTLSRLAPTLRDRICALAS